MHPSIALGKNNIRNLGQLIDGGEKRRTDAHSLAGSRIHHPVTAFLMQHAAEISFDKCRNAPGVAAQELGQQWQ
ncbi:hypothetical protein D3C80_1753130 [compost metagenome]